jgi:hypothetical protein
MHHFFPGQVACLSKTKMQLKLRQHQNQPTNRPGSGTDECHGLFARLVIQRCPLDRLALGASSKGLNGLGFPWNPPPPCKSKGESWSGKLGRLFHVVFIRTFF